MLGQALGLPDHHDVLFLHRRGRHFGDGDYFRAGDLGSGAGARRLGNPIAVVVAMMALLLATLNVNVAANVVSPSNDFSNLSPRRISFRTGGLITCVVGVAVFQPWKLLANYSNYIFGWLVGYSGFLGPIAGVMICDYFVVRKKIILVEDLYHRGGFYEFSGGFNWRAIAALAAGVGVALIGLVVPGVARPLRLRVVRGIRRELRRRTGR